MFVVYAIESSSRRRVYIGQTNDIEKRLRFHNSGYVKSTSKDTPWYMIAMESFSTREQARWCEKQLKNSKGARVKWLKQYCFISQLPARRG